MSEEFETDQGTVTMAEPEPDTAPAAEAPTPEETPQPEASKPQASLEDLVPRYEANRVMLIDRSNPGQPITREYVQRPLSFVGKAQLYSLVGDLIDRITEDMPLDQFLSELGMQRSTELGSYSAGDMRDVTVIARVIAKAMKYSPTFLQELFVILLNVPQDERTWAIKVMSNDVEDGGLDDETGFKILETAIDQNANAIQEFFSGKIGQLAARVQARLGGRGTPSKQ